MADSIAHSSDMKIAGSIPAESWGLVASYDLAIFGGPWLALWVLLKLAVNGKFPRRILIAAKE